MDPSKERERERARERERERRSQGEVDGDIRHENRSLACLSNFGHGHQADKPANKNSLAV